MAGGKYRRLYFQLGFLSEPEQGKNFGVAFFDQGSCCVPDDPFSCRHLLGLPGLAGFDDQLWVIFRNVIEVVGDRSPHIIGRIVFEVF